MLKKIRRALGLGKVGRGNKVEQNNPPRYSKETEADDHSDPTDEFFNDEEYSDQKLESDLNERKRILLELSKRSDPKPLTPEELNKALKTLFGRMNPRQFNEEAIKHLNSVISMRVVVIKKETILDPLREGENRGIEEFLSSPGQPVRPKELNEETVNRIIETAELQKSNKTRQSKADEVWVGIYDKDNNLLSLESLGDWKKVRDIIRNAKKSNPVYLKNEGKTPIANENPAKSQFDNLLRAIRVGMQMSGANATDESMTKNELMTIETLAKQVEALLNEKLKDKIYSVSVKDLREQADSKTDPATRKMINNIVRREGEILAYLIREDKIGGRYDEIVTNFTNCLEGNLQQRMKSLRELQNTYPDLLGDRRSSMTPAFKKEGARPAEQGATTPPGQRPRNT